MANWRDPNPNDYGPSKGSKSSRSPKLDEDAKPLTRSSARLYITISALGLLTFGAGFFVGRYEVSRYENSILAYRKEIETKLHDAEQQNAKLFDQLSTEKRREEDLNQKLARDEATILKLQQYKADNPPAPDKKKKGASSTDTSP